MLCARTEGKASAWRRFRAVPLAHDRTHSTIVGMVKSMLTSASGCPAQARALAYRQSEPLGQIRAKALLEPHADQGHATAVGS